MPNSRVLKNCSKDIQNIFEECRQSIMRYQDSMDRIQSDLNQFESQLTSISQSNEFFNKEQAHKLITQARAIIAYCQDQASADALPDLLAAVDYLVKQDDAYDDFHALDGLDDDEAVLSAVIDAFGLQTWVDQYANNGRGT
jgi:uncharacterized membrane protein YkvA (DUF1232 family)